MRPEEWCWTGCPCPCLLYTSKAADDIEKELQNELGGEVSSKQIGELVMEKLKDLDEVAYVRFASVYRQFKDINTFMDELNKLLDNKK